VKHNHTTTKNDLSRRDFIKTTAVGVGATAMAGLGASKAEASIPNKWDYEADVVIIGCGLAGVSAGVAAHDSGAEVLVLEKAPKQYTGGNSRVAGGGMKTPLFVSEEVFAYYKGLCFGTVSDQMVQDFIEALYKNPERIRKLGYDVYPSGTQTPTVAHLRITRGNGTGKDLYDAVKDALDERGVPVKYETRVQELVQNPETKEILGVKAVSDGWDRYIKARKGVIMACGGYENNIELKDYYNYPGLGKIIYPWGTPYNTGDGIKMVSEVGAPLWHLFSIEWDRMSLRLPSQSCGVGVQINSAGPGIMVNKYGNRFMNEAVTLGHNKETLALIYFSNVKKEYTNQPCFIVFDEKYRKARALANVGGSMTWNVNYKLCPWSTDNLAEIEKGWIVKADTIAELAEKMKGVDPLGNTVGVDAAGLQATVETYNGYCAAGADPNFSKPATNLISLDTPPYYAAELCMTLINTQGGPKHNGRSQTLNKENKPIPRLYSCGEFGSFFGFLYPGGSNLAEALAFGSIAGENAAGLTPWV
jgi:succinate dehydrogenase/fumarate reductase flavoprotein subunit